MTFPSERGQSATSANASAIRRLHRALSRAAGDDRWTLRLWDGTEAGPPAGSRYTVVLHDRAAADRMLGSLPERAFGRAYVEGLIDVEPLEPFVSGMSRATPTQLLSAWPEALQGLVALGARPHSAPVEDAEAQLRGIRHSRARDAAAIQHHYDLPAEFYALWLDKTMTYSCAYFASPESTLDEAQTAKLDLICRKLRLRQGETFLDIGCGWGGLVIHAATHYGVHATGITLSPAQAEYAQWVIRERGLEAVAEVRLADYRDDLGRHRAVASVGMVEHVGARKLPVFSRAVYNALEPGGRALIHGITKRPTDRWSRLSFNHAFVFPDGELEDIGLMVREYERAGLEVRDVESLREHYALTLDAWSVRLREHWDEAVELVGEHRARVWKLYMAGAAAGFRQGTIAIHQTLAVRPTAGGESLMPLLRSDWYRES